MSYLDPTNPGLGPDDWRGRTEEARQELRRIEQIAEQRDVLSQAKQVDYAAQKPRVSDRIRRLFSRGGAPPDSGEPELSQEQVWERERQRRLEYEQDRLDGKAG